MQQLANLGAWNAVEEGQVDIISGSYGLAKPNTRRLRSVGWIII